MVYTARMLNAMFFVTVVCLAQEWRWIGKPLSISNMPVDYFVSLLAGLSDHESQFTEAVLLRKSRLACSRGDVGVVGVRRAVVAWLKLVSGLDNFQ